MLPTVADELRRLVHSAGVTCIVSSWISDCIDTGHIIGMGPSHCPPSPKPLSQHAQLLPTVPPQNQPPQQQTSSSGTPSGESNSATTTTTPSTSNPEPSSSHVGTLRPDLSAATSTAAPTKRGNSQPVAPVDQSYEEGESEIDELDPLTPSVSPNKKRRGKAYSNDDIASMQAHYFEQMALSPRPPLTGIWESFAILVSYISDYVISTL